MEESNLSEAALTLQKAAAELLSEIRDFCKTSQKAADILVKRFDSLTDLYVDCLLEKFKQDLAFKSGHITIKDIESLITTTKGQSTFTGVQTRKQLESYLQEESGGKNVLLQQVILEEKVVLRGGAPVSVPTEYGYVVPFLPQMEHVLNCKDVMECVKNPRTPKDGEMCTVTDGLFYKHHPLVKLHGNNTLAITFHVDDAEVDDPLKSKAGKNNLRLFYWVLANIHPEKRSGLKAINLIAIVKSKTAKKFGNAHFLQNFIEGLIKLATEGVEFNINGKLERFYAVLLFGSADNPAACNIGGFKETHCALRPCRMCLIKSSDLLKLFVEDPELLRKIKEHKIHVKMVAEYNKKSDNQTNPKKNVVKIVNVYHGEDEISEIVPEGNESDLVEEKYLDHSNPSINFGVNGSSPLSDVPHFDDTKCLVLDILHLLFEGVVDVVCRLLLKDLCFPYHNLPKEAKKGKGKPALTLDIVNNVITQTADLGHLNVSRPTVIDKKHVLGSKLKQSGSQMIVLLYLMPFIIHKICPEEKMELLLNLIDLVNLCMSFKVKDTTCTRLREVVKDFLAKFSKLYPDVKTLKLHGLVHLATQMRLFGPLRQQWCFHFEAMHSEFTAFADVVKSRKNIAFSAASRHLAKRNAEIMKGRETGDYLCTCTQLKESRSFSVAMLLIKDSLLRKLTDLTEESIIHEVAEVTKDGNKWCEGVNILVKMEDDKCTFGRVSKIFIVNDQPVFIYNTLETTYIDKLRAYEICRSKAESDIVKLCDIPHPFPVARFSFHFPREHKSHLLFMSELQP